MSIAKNILKRLLNGVGLLTPVQETWRAHLRKVARNETAQLYQQFIGPGDLCFDVGANVGEISEVMLGLGARVVAIEPQSENIQALQLRFFGKSNFVLVPKALGSEIGSGELMICGRSECSSMSTEFIAAVTGSGRLPVDIYQWSEVRRVPTTTLDELIHDYGVPSFVKIDVEGFEVEVIKGCSHKLKALSFEFTPERLEPAFDCIAILERFGAVEFNYTVEFKKELQLAQWVSGCDLVEHLKVVRFPVVTAPGGDLYVRFVDQ